MFAPDDAPRDAPQSTLIEVPARPEQLGAARRAVADFVRGQTWDGNEWDGDDADALLLAVGEACSNAVCYGGAGLADPRLTVSCRCLDGGAAVQVDVRNQGNGFHPDLGTLGEMPGCGDYATHGRGFGLMLALVDDVQVLSDGTDTTVRLTKTKTKTKTKTETKSR